MNKISFIPKINWSEPKECRKLRHKIEFQHDHVRNRFVIRRSLLFTFLFIMMYALITNRDYIFGIELFKLSKPVIIGPINIEVEINYITINGPNVNYVEFFIDNDLKIIDSEEPYEWILDEKATKKRRDEMKKERIDKSLPFEEYWEIERKKITEDKLSELVKRCYSESLRLSKNWAKEFRNFWKFPDNFQMEVK